MSPKRNPKSKRVHDSDSGQFVSESKIDSLTPFGYNDGDDNSWLSTAIKFLIFIAVLIGVGLAVGIL